MTDPEIRAIAKLELKPGDTLVCFIPKDRYTTRMGMNISKAHERLYGPEIHLILTTDDFRFGVLTGGKEL